MCTLCIQRDVNITLLIYDKQRSDGLNILNWSKNHSVYETYM